MSRVSGMDAETAAVKLSEATGLRFHHVGLLSGGETGAHRFRRADGRPFVVKWDTTTDGRAFRQEAVVLSERLRREAGWPVPAESLVDADGVSFIIQEFMPGHPPGALTHALVDGLLDLHERRLGLAKRGDPLRWPMNLIQTLVSGGNGYCRHDSLRRYNDRTRSLISRIEAFGRSLRPEAFSAHDVVHWDLHPGNLLVEGGAISAIVDTDFVIVGDATFDLVMLALTSLGVHCERGVTTRLLSEAVGHLDELRAQAYLGHLFVRLIDWPIRRRNASEVDFWLDRSDEHLTI